MRVLLTFIVLVIGIFTAYYLTKQSMEQKQLPVIQRSEEHTSELQSRPPLVCRLLLEKKNLFLYPAYNHPMSLGLNINPSSHGTYLYLFSGLQRFPLYHILVSHLMICTSSAYCHRSIH